MIFKKIFRNRITGNAMWLMVGRVAQTILSFVISLLTARYLGPSNYGLINYAAAYATFFASFCTLGINSVIVKNLIDHPEEEGKTIGTTIVLRTVSSVLSVAVIIGISLIFDKGEPITIWTVSLYSLCLVFQVFDTINYWFQAKLLSKYYAFASLAAYAIVSVYKVFLLITGKSVQWFAISNAVDYVIIAAILYFFYKKLGGPVFSFSVDKAKELLRVSYSYIIPGLTVAVYAATDKMMLKQMLGESVVGHYALAITISSMWVFVLSAIIDSMKPVIMEYRGKDKKMYILMNKRMYAIVFYVSVAAAIGLSFIAPLFIKIVYGEIYLPAVEPLRIVVWYVAFSYLGVARDTWIICEQKQKKLKYIYIGSAALNVILNIILIPICNINGAAAASLVTQISTIFVFPIFIKDLKPNVGLVTEAIMLKDIFPKKTQKDV